MSDNIRTQKIKRDIKKALAEVFIKIGIFKVIFENIIITADFKQVKIAVASLDNSETPEELIEGLNKKIPLIASNLKKSLKISKFPRFRFFYDESFIKINKVLEIMEKIRAEDSEFYAKQE